MTGIGLAPVCGSELTKIRSLRSAAASLAVTAGLTLVLCLLSGWSVRRAIDTHSSMLLPDFDPASAGFDNLAFAQLGLVAFGVLLVTSEYVSGQIRISMTAVPARSLLYGAKLLVGAGIAFVVSLPLTAFGYLLTEFGLGPHAAHVTAPVVRAWFAGAVYLTLICVLSAAVATVLRSQVLSLTLLLTLFSVGSQALAQIPGARLLMRFLPDLAGARGMAVRPGSADALSPGIGLLVMAGWVVVGLIAAFVVVGRRDA